MGFAEWTAAFAALATAVQLITTAIAAIRCRARTKPVPPPEGAAPVTIVRPVCGVENFARETLASSLALDYPQYRVLFCAARADDPAVPLVRELLAAHPDADAALLIGDDRAGPNPKLNNTIKGFDAATTDWIIMADSNVLMPHDYIQRLLARWRPNSGVVVSLPIGARPANFAAELECAFLNTYQARWEYVSDTLGMGFAQGKNMLFRRDILEAAGGIRALGADIAEDAATTKLVRSSGRAAHLMDAPFDQPLGPRSFRELWARQVRWARLRRITFPLLFAPELLCGCAFPLAAAVYAGARWGVSLPATGLLLLGAWFGAEAALARCAGWHFSWRMPLALLLRDLTLPALWIEAWRSDAIVWRGNTVSEAKARGAGFRELSASPAYALARRITTRYRARWLGR